MSSIPFGKPLLGEEEKAAAARVIDSGHLTHGPEGAAFESEFRGFVGAEAHCVAVSSCMGALHLAFLKLGVAPGDEVIVAAQNHAAAAQAVELVGARPVFADCESGTGNIDIAGIEPLITSRTKALAIVHFLGIPCDMEAIAEIAGRHGLLVVEDCALALGARWRGMHVGLWGDAGTFSFYPAKHITTGEGGMFVSRHKDLAERVRRARGFGVDRTIAERTVPGVYAITESGLNYRLSDINAALGRPQLRKIEHNLRRRRENTETLTREMAGIEGVRMLQPDRKEAVSAHYCLSVVLEDGLAERREEVIGKLNQAGIGTSIYYPHPVPRHPLFREKYGYERERYREAERISDCSIALPVGPHVSLEDCGHIAMTLATIVRGIQQ